VLHPRRLATLGGARPWPATSAASRIVRNDNRLEVGDLDHLKVFLDKATADTWRAESDPEGVAFEYEVLE
jgi:hypothetical protein